MNEENIMILDEVEKAIVRKQEEMEMHARGVEDRKAGKSVYTCPCMYTSLADRWFEGYFGNPIYATK